MKGIVLLGICAALALGAADTITEPETERTFKTVLNGKSPEVQLVCTGVACRKKTTFAAKVYAIAHWIDGNAAEGALASWKGKTAEELRGDQGFYDALCSADIEKRFMLIFVRNVSGKQVREGFEDSLVLAYPDGKLPQVAKDFLALFQAKLKKGESIQIRSLPGGIVEVYDRRIRLGKLGPDPAFATAVWQMYFQEKVVDDHLAVVKKDLISRIDALW
ncbi:MAG: chalcone isomerase family protein [Planctomycetota bacterium]|jgi:hypothetical protein